MKEITRSVNQLRSNLIRSGVGPSAVVLFHSGLGSISKKGLDQIAYASAVVDMLMDLVSDSGTIMMPCDSIADIYKFSYKKKIFEPDSMRSRRGLISEVFRLKSDVLRSRHPWCNAAAWGKYADWLLKDHVKSAPFAMDQYSPWYKFIELDGQIIYFGVTPANASQSSTVPECVLGYDYPVGVFFDKPLPLLYRTVDDQVKLIAIQPHVHDWSKDELVDFFLYLDRVYTLHSYVGTGEEKLIFCSAKRQYNSILDALGKGFAFTNVRYWR